MKQSKTDWNKWFTDRTSPKFFPVESVSKKKQSTGNAANLPQKEYEALVKKAAKESTEEMERKCGKQEPEWARHWDQVYHLIWKYVDGEISPKTLDSRLEKEYSHSQASLLERVVKKLENHKIAVTYSDDPKAKERMLAYQEAFNSGISEAIKLLKRG